MEPLHFLKQVTSHCFGEKDIYYIEKDKVVLTSPGEMINLLSSAEYTEIRTGRMLVSWLHRSPMRLCL